jgi:hypothetical protein
MGQFCFARMGVSVCLLRVGRACNYPCRGCPANAAGGGLGVTRAGVSCTCYLSRGVGVFSVLASELGARKLSRQPSRVSQRTAAGGAFMSF